MTEFECTLIVFAYQMNRENRHYLKSLTNETREGRLLHNPTQA